VTEFLPPVVSRYGDRLQIFSADVDTPTGEALFRAAVKFFHVPARHQGVPALIIGDHFVYGTKNIPAEFTRIVDEYLSRGGVGLPSVPGMSESLKHSESTTRPSPAGLPGVANRSTGILDRVRRDPLGNALALAVLLGMLVALVRVALTLVGARPGWSAEKRTSAVVVLVLLGLGIAAYLAYVETTDAVVLCGSLSHCDAVQQSRFARLFGVLPVGYVGVVGYLAMGICLGIARYADGRAAHAAEVCLFCLALLGTVFSVYLTALEPFVIGATCLWCLGSSVIMTLVLLLTARTGTAYARSSNSGQGDRTVLDSPNRISAPSKPRRRASRLLSSLTHQSTATPSKNDAV
jgi:uncharacterized membrane protein